MALADSIDVDEIRVLAPVPSFPTLHSSVGPYAALAAIPKQENHGLLKVFYPRYLNVPLIGMHLQPGLMAKALLPAVEAQIKSGYDFDIIDAYYFYPDGVAAAIVADKLDKPLIITAFGSDITYIAANSRLVARKIRRSANQAGSCTAVCQALSDAMVHIGVPEDKLHVVMHGVDLALFRPPSNRSAIRQAFKMTRTSLLCAGHLVELKGMHFAVEALAQLPDVELFIAGEGPEGAPPKKTCQTFENRGSRNISWRN